MIWVVAQDFHYTYWTVLQAVRFLSLDPLLKAPTVDERLEALKTISTVLKNQHEVSAIQVGYGNGDYSFIRLIFSKRVRKLFDAIKDVTNP